MPRRPVPFWERVNKESGRWFAGSQCWEYTGTGGMGQHGHRRYKIPGGAYVGAHRYAYEQLVGPIPEGAVLDHRCDNPPCVNPAHLQPTTQHDNLTRSARTIAGANAAKTQCANGHAFTEENTYWCKGRGGVRYRSCRACKAARERQYNAEKRGTIARVRRPSPAPTTPAPRTPRTHCAQGHALVGDNRQVRATGKVDCRECRRAYLRDYRARRKEPV